MFSWTRRWMFCSISSTSTSRWSRRLILFSRCTGRSSSRMACLSSTRMETFWAMKSAIYPGSSLAMMFMSISAEALLGASSQ